PKQGILWLQRRRLWLYWLAQCSSGDVCIQRKEFIMARPASGTNLTIAQLQRVLNEKKSELDRLHRQRGVLQKKMNVIDRQIERRTYELKSGRSAKKAE